MQTFNMQRVKVYRLNKDGLWDDNGTGHVSMEYMEQSDSVGLVVISEEDTSTLLIHRISRDDIYQRQGDNTIITWSDAEVGTEIALSFQEAQGCTYVWGQILEVQGHYSPRDGAAPRRGPVDEFEIQTNQMDGDAGQEGSAGSVDLPAAELGNLPEIVKAITECTRFQRERIAQQMLRPSYIRKLLDIFKTCEDLEDSEGLANMYKVIKGTIMLNDNSIFELLLKEENVMDVVGALEHDPELPEPQKHREFLSESVVFKEVVPIKDPAIREKIHQTYRIGYIKDVILPRVLDDATFATLASLMLFNNVDVLTALQNDTEFMEELFTRLRRAQPHQEEWQDLVAFVQELCTLAKHLHPPNRAQLFAKLLDLGMLDVLTEVMKSGNADLQLPGSDVLLSILQHDPSPLRSFLLKQEDHTLFTLLIGSLIESGQSGEAKAQGGLQEQVLEMLKLLLDPESMEQSVEKNDFLELFYDHYIGQLVDTLARGAPPAKAAAEPLDQKQPPTPATMGTIVELLCFCVQHHSFRIKYYILRNHVVEKVLRLLRCPQRWLMVAAVRFLRTCIGLKDEFYNRYLIRNNLLEPVVKAFNENGPRYNLLNSAILELVEFVRKENIKGLIVHLVEQFYDHTFQNIDYVDTFKQLKLKYDQALERPASSAAAGSPSTATQHARELLIANRRRRDNNRGLDKAEEDYFNEDDDDDSGDGDGKADSAAPAMIGPQPAPPPAAKAQAHARGCGKASKGSDAVMVTEAEPSGARPLFPLVDYDDDDEDEEDESKQEERKSEQEAGTSAFGSSREGSPGSAVSTAKRPGEGEAGGVRDLGKRQRTGTGTAPEDGTLITTPATTTPVAAGGGPGGLFWQQTAR
mmetsp:Transcript_36846/g.103965  ORF Transcript_36846/g.103965 Transcript_36846/m.103965 type:complete len:862 (+) Transcript_36846:313-2898(+)